MNTPTILFDYSGVLTTSLSLPQGDLPFDPDALFIELAGALSTLDPHPWHDLERGQIPLTEFCDYIDERIPGGSAMFAADSDLNVMKNLELRPERLAVAEELQAAGRRVGLVTNNVAEWQPHWLPRLPTGVFDVVIDSAAVGCRKPEAAIYTLAMEQMGVDDSGSVLFIDDFEWNVTGAIEAGLQGLHCPADLDLRAAIDQLGLL
jgi:putative hydrolase of the HAD superfamily